MANIERAYDLGAAVEAHRAASVGNWTRLSDMQYDAIAGSALRTANYRGAVALLRDAATELGYAADLVAGGNTEKHLRAVVERIDSHLAGGQ